MTVTYPHDRPLPHDTHMEEARPEPYVPVYARTRGSTRGRKGGVKTWMILAPIGVLVLGGAALALAMGQGDEVAPAPLVEPAATGPVLPPQPLVSEAAPVEPPATATVEAPPAPVPVVRAAPAPARRAAPVAARRTAPAPTPATREAPAEPAGPQPYTATLNTTPGTAPATPAATPAPTPTPMIVIQPQS